MSDRLSNPKAYRVEGLATKPMSRLFFVVILFAALWQGGETIGKDRGWAAAIAWRPDGQMIAIASTTGVWLFGSEFNELGHVQVKQTENDEPKQGQAKQEWDLPHRSLSWNAAGDLLAVGDVRYGRTPIQIIDIGKLEVVSEISTRLLAWTPIQWHPADNLIVVGTYGGTAHIFDALTGEEVFYFVERKEGARGALSNYTVGFCWFDEDVIVIATHHEIYVIDIASKELLQTVDPDTVFDTTDCNREHQLITTNGKLYDIRTGSLISVFTEYDSHIDEFIWTLDVAWSPDGRRFVSSTEGCLVRVFDGGTGELLARLSGGIHYEYQANSFFLSSIAWHPDGGSFAVVGQFGDIRVWDVKTYALLRRFDGFELFDEYTLLPYKTREEFLEHECPE
ncbi:MAG: hypothetical protein OXG60_06690 [Chloroflexi bacterium]|nr:hypothetical protein [Chloroflexota bacterium]